MWSEDSKRGPWVSLALGRDTCFAVFGLRSKKVRQALLQCAGHARWGAVWVDLVLLLFLAINID